MRVVLAALCFFACALSYAYAAQETLIPVYTSGHVSVCNAHSSCGACSAVLGCGWCPKAQACQHSSNPCAGQQFTSCSDTRTYVEAEAGKPGDNYYKDRVLVTADVVGDRCDEQDGSKCRNSTVEEDQEEPQYKNTTCSCAHDEDDCACAGPAKPACGCESEPDCSCAPKPKPSCSCDNKDDEVENNDNACNCTKGNEEIKKQIDDLEEHIHELEERLARNSSRNVNDDEKEKEEEEEEEKAKKELEEKEKEEEKEEEEEKEKQEKEKVANEKPPTREEIDELVQKLKEQEERVDKQENEISKVSADSEKSNEEIDEKLSALNSTVSEQIEAEDEDEKRLADLEERVEALEKAVGDKDLPKKEESEESDEEKEREEEAADERQLKESQEQSDDKLPTNSVELAVKKVKTFFDRALKK